jgi:multicomponent Na+:H+ antiporter subunit E
VIRYIGLYVVLCAFWVVLSGHLNWADAHDKYFMISGAVSCALAVALSAKVGFLDKEGPLGRFLLGMLSYFPWLFWQIVKSNWDVLKRVWSPDMKLDPVVFETPYKMKTELSVVTFANSITITPGTITIAIEPGTREFLCHALTPAGADLQAMHDRCKALEGDVSE